MMTRFMTALLALTLATPAMAEPTEVTVRVIARDAKFIGTSMGGVQVTLQDASNGAVLARGITQGGTGDTGRIMHAQGRGDVRANPQDAAFTAQLDLKEPTLVTLAIEGPLGHPGSMLRASQQRWVVPGEPVTAGDGWVIELPGLVITPHLTRTGSTARLTAKVELMCGCPITPGGLWDAADYVVQASLWREDQRIAATDLHFMTSPGGYEAEITLPAGTGHRLLISARNVRTGNSGLVEVPIGAE